MLDPLARQRLLLVFVLGVSAVIVWVLSLGATVTAKTDYLSVTFLDVGQGDAAFITTPEGKQILIDGGRDGSVLRGLSKEMSFFDRTIDLVVATHPDSDHIGGLIDVLHRYEVQAVLLTENENDSPAATEFKRLLEKEAAEIIYARAGQKFNLGSSTDFSVLWPATDPTYMETNTASIILQLSHGEIDFMFTGDAPKRIEEYLVEVHGNGLESEVLKVGHHGSRTSTAKDFVVSVNPEYAVLSYDKDNSYGHPHEEVTDVLQAAEVKVLSTAEESNITIFSDGEGLWLK